MNLSYSTLLELHDDLWLLLLYVFPLSMFALSNLNREF